ncbi:unnamed protein product [Cunninghamella blakesleeana]
MATSANNIPSIPLSPLTKTWLVCQENLDQADEALKKAKKQFILVKLFEDVKIEQLQYDTLKRQMTSLQTKSCFYWSPDSLAKQIAIVDCQLFSLVKLDKPLLCQFDLKSTNLDKLLDFHHYLTNNFAHQLIFWSDQVSSSSSSPKESMVSHLVQVAYALFHTFRDLSGFAAIMKALMLPEVRRLRSIWKRCSSRIKEMYTEMAAIMSSDHHYQAYHEALYKKLAYYFFNPPSSSSSSSSSIMTTNNNNNNSDSSLTKMVIIPWIQPHLISIHSIVTDYAAVGGGHATSQVPAASGLCYQDIDFILSAPGLQKLAIVIALLEQCQQFITPSSSSSSISSQINNASSSMDILEDVLKPWRKDFISSNSNDDGVDHTNKKKTRRQSVISMPPKLSFDNNSLNYQQQQSVQYLNHLYPGDLSVHHWLVSRVYLRKDQLVDESIQVQPLSPGEQLLCDYAPDDETIMNITNKKQLEYIQHHQQQKKQQQLKMDELLDDEENIISDFKNISPRISATFAGWKSTTNLDLSLSLPHENNNDNGNNDDSKDNNKDQSSSTTDNNNKKDDNNNNNNNSSDDKDDGNDNNGDGDILNKDSKPILSQELDDINMNQQHQHVLATEEATVELTTKTEPSPISSKEDTSLDDLLVLTTRKPELFKRSKTDLKADANDKDNNVLKEKSIEKKDDQLLSESNNNNNNNNNKIEKEENNNISKNSVINNNNNKNTTTNNDTITPTTTVTNITKPDTSIPKENEQQQPISIESPKTIENNKINHTNNNQYNNDKEKDEKDENKSKKSKLSPTAPEFVPTFNHQKKEGQQPISLSAPSTPPTNNNDAHYQQEMNDNDSESEQWNGYPTPPTLEEQPLKQSNHSGDDDEDDDNDEVWTGYPGANGTNHNHHNNRPASIQSVVSDEWKGYQAAKMEATWEMETALKVQLHEWQGYTLETLNEEELQGQ